MSLVSFLPDNQMKEYISIRYIQSIANFSGFCTSPKDDINDYGCDIVVSSIIKNTYKNKKEPSYSDSGLSIDLQLKATTQKNFKILKSGGYYSYELRLKNYNEIVRKKEENLRAMYLIVFVCSEDITSLLKLNPTDLVLYGEAYYWIPDKNDKTDYDRDSKSTKTIHIEKNNKVDIDFFNKIFKKEFNL